MSNETERVLAVIPARGGSKGLPGKNIRPFLNLPLIAHSILFARMCPEISRCIVSTDSGAIADVARRFDGDLPFQRPSELAQDDTPMWDVLRHALSEVEKQEGRPYGCVLLLDPTSPARLPEDVAAVCKSLISSPDADGVVGVSRPEFNPIWHCVIEREGWMNDLIPEGSTVTRRQDVPPVYRINGSLYLWKSEFLRTSRNWRQGRHRIFEIPEIRAMSIDTEEQFRLAEILVQSGLVTFPWLAQVN